ncbi:hypothetical protein HNP40_000596 [Mycobacteroides chelonae]|nr:hypothetical protein [Mycobacteroides chelonae]
MTAAALDRLREIIRPEALSGGAHPAVGYLDLLPPPSDQPQPSAQRAMNNPLLAAVYEGPWRLLDVACGPETSPHTRDSN